MIQSKLSYNCLECKRGFLKKLKFKYLEKIISNTQTVQTNVFSSIKTHNFQIIHFG